MLQHSAAVLASCPVNSCPLKSVLAKTVHCAGGVGPQVFAQPVALPTHAAPGCFAASHQLAGMQSDLLLPPPSGTDVCTQGEPYHRPARPSLCAMHTAHPCPRRLGQETSLSLTAVPEVLAYGAKGAAGASGVAAAAITTSITSATCWHMVGSNIIEGARGGWLRLDFFLMLRCCIPHTVNRSLVL